MPNIFFTYEPDLITPQVKRLLLLTEDGNLAIHSDCCCPGADCTHDDDKTVHGGYLIISGASGSHAPVNPSGSQVCPCSEWNGTWEIDFRDQLTVPSDGVDWCWFSSHSEFTFCSPGNPHNINNLFAVWRQTVSGVRRWVVDLRFGYSGAPFSGAFRYLGPSTLIGVHSTTYSTTLGAPGTPCSGIPTVQLIIY